MTPHDSAPAAAAASTPPSFPAHSVLVLGCGSIGERHLRNFQRTGRARLTACDSNPALLAMMAERYGVATAGDWQAALASGGLDACVICTPAHLHVPMAIAALQHGLHVLVESRSPTRSRAWTSFSGPATAPAGSSRSPTCCTFTRS